MSHSTYRRIDAELAEFGIYPIVDRSISTARRACEVRCACGQKIAVVFQANMPPSVIIKNFQAKGWKVSRVATECPACISLPKKRKDQMTTPTKVASMTPDDKAKIREFLDGHYDERRQCLLDGHTDKSAGEKLSVPWAWVRDVREAAYGPIKTNSEMLEIREEIADFEREVKRLSDRLIELFNRIAAAEKKISS